MLLKQTPWAAALLVMALGSASALAQADSFLDMAKKKVAIATMAKDKWDGPTTGPKAAAARTIVFVAGDMKNGGIVGVSKGVEEAGKAIGWTVRVIDGQGTVSARTAALNQALALKPAGIVVGGFDTTEQKAAFEGAAKAGVPLVGWHSGEQPGPNDKVHPVTKMFLILSGANKAFEGDLAAALGPEEAHRLAMSDDMCSHHSTWGGGKKRDDSGAGK